MTGAEWIAAAGLVLRVAKATDGPLRDRLGVRPDQLAFKRAFVAAMEQTAANDRALAEDLFNLEFLKRRGAAVLIDFVTGASEEQIASELASAWREQFDPDNRTADRRMADVESGAADLLRLLEREVAKSGVLRDAASLRAQARAVEELKGLRRDLAPTALDEQGVLLEFLEWLIARNTYLDARGTLQTQRQVQLRLDDIFVGLTASETETIDADRAEPEGRDGERGSQGVLTRVPLADAVQHNSHVAILGDPGGGKSTLVRYLALHHATALAQGRTEAEAELGAPKVPVLIRVASLVEQDGWRQQSLLRTIVVAFEAAECPTVGLEEVLAARLASGHVLALFDGLDEVPDADDRRTIVRKIEDFMRRYEDAGNGFVVTSRIAGYRDAAMSRRVRHFIIRSMSPDEQEAFLTKWCRAVEDSQTPELPSEERQRVADREILAITSAIADSPGVAALAVNPLLLRILALIHRTGARLPEKRVELYKLAADTLAQTWRLAQGVPESELVKEQFLTKLLSHLGFWMHSTQPSGAAPYDDVFRVLAQEWCRLQHVEWDQDDPSVHVTEQVEAFLERVRIQTGLFVERSPGQFGFMHLTFEEYYAARTLIRKPRLAAAQIRKHLHDPRWREPILLCLGFKGLDFPEEASDLVRVGVLGLPELDDDDDPGFGSSRFEAFLHRDLVFCLDCIADGIPVETGLITEVVQNAVSIIRNNSDDEVPYGYSEEVAVALATVIKNPEIPVDPRPELERQVSASDSGSEAAFETLCMLHDAPEEYAASVWANVDYPLALRRRAFRRACRLRDTDEWAQVVIETVERDDANFIDLALPFIDSHLPEGSDFSKVEPTILRHLDSDELGTLARNAVFDLYINETSPSLVDFAMGVALDESADSNSRSRATIALSSGNTERSLTALGKVLGMARAAQDNDLIFDALYALEVGYVGLVEVGPITEFVDIENLGSSDYVEFRDRDDDVHRVSEAEFLRRIEGDCFDKERAFYIGALTTISHPSRWWRRLFTGFALYGEHSKLVMAELALTSGASVEEVGLLAKESDPAVRVFAASALSGVVRSTAAEGLVRSLLTDPEASVRRRAAAVAPWSKWLEVDEWGGRLLADDDSEVRAAAWNELAGRPWPTEDYDLLRRSLGIDCGARERGQALAVGFDTIVAHLDDELREVLSAIDPPGEEPDLAAHVSASELFAQGCMALGEAGRVDDYVASHILEKGIDYRYQSMIRIWAARHPDPLAVVNRFVAQALEHSDRQEVKVRSVCRIVTDLANSRQDQRNAIADAFERSALPLLSHQNTEIRAAAINALRVLAAMDGVD